MLTCSFHEHNYQSELWRNKILNFSLRFWWSWTVLSSMKLMTFSHSWTRVSSPLSSSNWLVVNHPQNSQLSVFYTELYEYLYKNYTYMKNLKQLLLEIKTFLVNQITISRRLVQHNIGGVDFCEPEHHGWACRDDLVTISFIK